MKKTLLGVVAITILLVALLATTVNAALLTASEEKVEKGESVNVTIRTKQPVESMQFTLNFDATKYEFDKSCISEDDVNMIGNGELMVFIFGGEPKSELTLKFKAIESGEAIPFTISETEFSNDEAMENSTIYVTVTEPVAPTQKPEENEQQPGQTENKEQGSNEVNSEAKQEVEKEEKYINEEGEVIKNIPQTGVFMPAVMLVVVALGIVLVASYKRIKNK